MSTLSIIRMPHAEGLELPSYETQDAAGMDFSTHPVQSTLIIAVR